MRQETKARIRKEIYVDLGEEISMLEDFKKNNASQEVIDISRERIAVLRQRLKDLREGRLARRIQAEAEKKLD